MVTLETGRRIVEPTNDGVDGWKSHVSRALACFTCDVDQLRQIGDVVTGQVMSDPTAEHIKLTFHVESGNGEVYWHGGRRSVYEGVWRVAGGSQWSGMLTASLGDVQCLPLP